MMLLFVLLIFKHLIVQIINQFYHVKYLFSALLLSFCQKKQENEEGQLGWGFSALDFKKGTTKMQKTLLVLAIIFISSIFIQGCASTQKDWEIAHRKDNIYSYKKFIRKHSDSDYTKQARDRIAVLQKENLEFDAYNSARWKDSISAYEHYLAEYPDGKYSKQAIIALEAKQHEFEIKQRKSLFLSTRKEGTVAAYEEFIKLYPNENETQVLRKELPELRKKEELARREKEEFEKNKVIGVTLQRMALRIFAPSKKTKDGGTQISLNGEGMVVRHPATLKKI